MPRKLRNNRILKTFRTATINWIAWSKCVKPEKKRKLTRQQSVESQISYDKKALLDKIWMNCISTINKKQKTREQQPHVIRENSNHT